MNEREREEINGGVVPIVIGAGITLGKVIGGAIAAGVGLGTIYFAAYAVGKEEGYNDAKYEYYHTLNNPTPTPVPTPVPTPTPVPVR